MTDSLEITQAIKTELEGIANARSELDTLNSIEFTIARHYEGKELNLLRDMCGDRFRATISVISAAENRIRSYRRQLFTLEELRGD